MKYWEGRVYFFDEETLKVGESANMGDFLDMYSNDRYRIEKTDFYDEDYGSMEDDIEYSIQVYDPSVRSYIEVRGFGGYYSLERAESNLDRARLFCYLIDVENDSNNLDDALPYPRKTREEAESYKEYYFEMERERELDAMDY